MAKKNTQPDDDIIDLTELVVEGPSDTNDQGEGNGSGDDFEAVFASASGKTQKPNRPVDPNEELDMSDMGAIDNFLESLEIPAQPGEDDAPARKSASAKLKKPAAPPPDEMEDVAGMFEDMPGGDAGAGNTGHASPAGAEADLDELDSALDGFLSGDISEAPQPAAPKKAAAQAYAKAAPEVDPDIDSELDDLLGEGPAPDTEFSKSTKAAPSPDAEGDLDDILSAYEAKNPANADMESSHKLTPEEARVDEDLDNILAQMETPASGDFVEDVIEDSVPLQEQVTEKTPEQDNFDLPPDLDALLDEQESQPQSGTANINNAGVEKSADFLDAENGARAVAKPAAEESLSKEMIAGVCQTLLAAQTDSIHETLREFSSKLGAQTARLEEMAGSVAALAKRVLACESRLGAVRQKIAGIESDTGKLAHVEDLFKEGTPLHNGFAKVMAASIGKAIDGAKAQDDSAQQIMALKNAFMSGFQKLEQRVESLEKKQDAEEPRLLENLNETHAAIESRLAALEAREDNPSGSGLADKMENMHEMLEAVQKRFGEMEGRLEDVSMRLDNESGLAEEVHSVKEEAGKALASAQAIEERLGNLENMSNDESAGEMHDLKAAQEDANARMSALEQRVAGLEAVEDSQKDAELLVGIESVKAEGQAAATRLAELGERVSSIESEINSRGGEDAAASIEAIRAEGTETGSRIKAIEESMTDLGNKLTKFAQYDIESLEAESRTGSLKFEEIEKRLTTIEAEAEKGITLASGLETMREELNAGILRIESTEKKITEIEKAQNAEKNTVSAEELARAMNDVEETRLRLTDFEGRMVTVEKAFTANQSLEADMASLKSLGESMQTSIQALDEKFGQSSAELAEMTGLTAEVKELKAGMQADEEKLSGLNGRIEGIEKGLQAVRGSADGKEELEVLRGELDQLVRRLDAIENNPEKDLQVTAGIANLKEEELKFAERLDVLEKKMSEFEAEESGSGKSSSVEIEELINGAAEETASRFRAVEERIAGIEASAQAEDGEDMKACIAGLNLSGKSAAARMDSLEKRLDELEPNFNVQVQKAAAAAVARILHEEISRLVEGK